MTQSWKAVPIEEDEPEGPALKAPNMAEYRRQTDHGWRPNRTLREEYLPIARALVNAIVDDDLRLQLKKKEEYSFRLYRYPHGLAVELPGGWTYFYPTTGQVRDGYKSTKIRPEPEEQSFKDAPKAAPKDSPRRR